MRKFHAFVCGAAIAIGVCAPATPKAAPASAVDAPSPPGAAPAVPVAAAPAPPETAPASAEAASAGSGVVPAAVSAATSAPKEDLDGLLALLAKRANLHRSLLYSFHCDEDLTRRVFRPLTHAKGGYQPDQTEHARVGIVLEQGKDGIASAVRVKLGGDGAVKLDREGRPVEARLPRAFDPILGAVPHAQAAVFTAEHQKEMRFSLMRTGDAKRAVPASAPAKGSGDGAQPTGPPDAEPAFQLTCAPGQARIEFLDRMPPSSEPECSAQASGQLCLDSRTGEIARIVFYGLDREGKTCVWNREAPFASVEQGILESKTGARFPSRVKTIYSLDARDNAIFEQRFENCGFSSVEVTASYGTVAE